MPHSASAVRSSAVRNGRRKRQDIALIGRTGGQRVGQYRAVAGRADRQRDRRRAVAPRSSPRRLRKASLPSGRQVAAGVGGIDLLDEEVLDIAAGRREAPGDPVVVADRRQTACRRRCRRRSRAPASSVAPDTRSPARRSRGAGRWRRAACRSRCARRRRPSCSRRRSGRPPAATPRRGGRAGAGDRSSPAPPGWSARRPGIRGRGRRGPSGDSVRARRARSNSPR